MLRSGSDELRSRSRLSWASSDAARNVMRANHKRDTGPELRLRRHLHRLGLRYQLGRRIGTSPSVVPDLVFVSARVAVFVDGCFWHGCPNHYVPSISNREYWADKISRNKARDADTNTKLQQEGWLPIRVWAHEDPQQVAELIATTVRERTKTKQFHL